MFLISNNHHCSHFIFTTRGVYMPQNRNEINNNVKTAEETLANSPPNMV